MLFQPGHFCQGHAPVVDGPGGFIPDYPHLLRESGDFDENINIMSGYNSEDGSLYTVFSMLLHTILSNVMEQNKTTFP